MKNKFCLGMLLLASILPVGETFADQSPPDGQSAPKTLPSSENIGRQDIEEFPAWGRYAEHIGGLRNHARSPTDSQVHEFKLLRPCDCNLQKVLVEMPHRITYFFDLPSSRGGQQALLTVWRYKQDGASFDMSRAKYNVKVGESDGHLSMAPSQEGNGALLKLSWLTNPEAYLATSVEFAVRTEDASDTHVGELARLIGTSARRVDIAVQP